MRPKLDSVERLSRNDVRSAILLRRWLLSSKRWVPEDDTMIIQLQDDPSELFKQMDVDDARR